MSTHLDERLAHEREFHDDRYREENRGAQDKYYEGLQESDARFRAFVDRFRPKERVLELGCGIDSLAFSLAERGVEVVGIDISPVAVDTARREAKARGISDVRFEVMNAEVLDFDDATFDGIVGTAVLHHLDIVCAYREMSRVLRPNGRAVFIEPLGHNPAINAYRRRTPATRTEFEHPLRCEDFSLAQRYFEEVHVELFHLLSVLSSPIANRWWGRPVHATLRWVDRRLLALSERLRWQAWIAVAELRRPR